MLVANNYKNWVLPTLLKIPEWSEFIDVLVEELVTLQMYNMGSYNKSGFNGVAEDVTFDNSNIWALCSDMNLTNGVISGTGLFTLNSGVLLYAGCDGVTKSSAICQYGFVIGKKYKVEFDILNLEGNPTDLHYGIGQDNVYVMQPSDTLIHFEIELLAADYVFSMVVLANSSIADLSIGNLKITGILDESDELERIAVLKKLVSVDNASHEVLEMMRDSVSFPSIANLPDSLLRTIITDYNTFIGLGGTELASSMFFYFMGYSAEFVHLYAKKEDYNAKQYSYIAQKEDELFESNPVGTIYGRVSVSAYSNKVYVYSGHKIIKGDFVGNQNHPFEPPLLEVVEAGSNYIKFNYAVNVVQGDYLDIYRKYAYAINPDPVEYFKTSHIDVFFKQKYTDSINLSFAQLQEYFERYLPINVVIRFFGYKTEPEDEEFSMRTALFDLDIVKNESIGFIERPTYPADAYAYVVHSTTPATHIDVRGLPVDGYSYVLVDYDAQGKPIYVIND